MVQITKVASASNLRLFVLYHYNSKTADVMFLRLKVGDAQDQSQRPARGNASANKSSPTPKFAHQAQEHLLWMPFPCSRRPQKFGRASFTLNRQQNFWTARLLLRRLQLITNKNRALISIVIAVLAGQVPPPAPTDCKAITSKVILIWNLMNYR